MFEIDYSSQTNCNWDVDRFKLDCTKFLFTNDVVKASSPWCSVAHLIHLKTNLSRLFMKNT